MIRFESDYLEGAHPLIIQALSDTNMEQTPGYGVDRHCEHARELIRHACQAQNADIHFLIGGTQTNATVIDAILKPYQAVICSDTGHINCHETGAIEACGHKVLPISSSDGKLTASDIEKIYREHWEDEDHEHMVQPAMVYISHPTENGTLYTKKELTEISRFCRTACLPLFLDGARLGYGLAARGSDLTLPDFARLCDVFYIGGTKVGALFGEAVVITKEELKPDFRYYIKQHGAMLAKGRLLGIQFETLFTDDLYTKISAHAITLAMEIRKAFQEVSVPFLYDSCTNQQFPILDNDVIRKLGEKYSFSPWRKIDNTRQAVRFCTSWATQPQYVVELCQDIHKLFT